MSRDVTFKDDEMHDSLNSKPEKPTKKIKISLSNFNIEKSETLKDLKTKLVESDLSLDHNDNNPDNSGENKIDLHENSQLNLEVTVNPNEPDTEETLRGMI